MMNQEDIFKKIGLILNELQDQYEYLAQNPQQLNELELELFMANAHFLSDHVQIVQKINNSNVQKQLPEHAGKSENHIDINEVSPAAIAMPTASSADPEDILAAEHLQESTAAIATPVSTSTSHSHFEEESLNAHDVQEADLAEEPVNDVAATTVSVNDEPATAEPVAGLPAKTTEKEEIPSLFDKEVFKIDNESSSFEFILKDDHLSDKFDFEEKSIDDIFDRPLSKEEEFIIAQKQKLRAQQDQRKLETEEEDEIGPEPFLVAKEEDVVPAATTDLVPDRPELKEMPLEREIQYTSNEEPAELKPQAQSPVAPPPAAQAPESHANPPASAYREEKHEPVEDKTEDSKLTLNERLAGQMGTKPSAVSSGRQTLTDLKQGININDKMLYVKDLFNGYGLAYSEVIDQLNKMPDFKTADAFLQSNYAVKNNWAAKQGTVDKFYELLNQRFPVQ